MMPVCFSIIATCFYTTIIIQPFQLYSCGLNKYHVLGSTTNNDKELTPIKVQGALRSVKVIGCAAAKLHSVVWTENHAVFTFGTNGGQLGGYKIIYSCAYC